MYNLLRVVGVREADRGAFGRALGTATGRLPGTSGTLAAPTLPGVYNGGDFLWRVRFPDRAAAEAAWASEAGGTIRAMLDDGAAVTSLDAADFATGHAGGDPAAPAGLYRVAMFCANRDPTPARLAAFSADAQTMPDHVRTIVRWELSEPDHAAGTRPWTHLWEQEYGDRSGLEGAYMMHPVHWSHVERWFDTEYPDYLVDRQLVHTFCAIDHAILHRGA